MRNLKLDENYYLLAKEVNNNVTVDVAKKTNHIFVVDVSGSMSGELQLIRTQLKNKLSSIMNEGDTISIVWFSGKNDAGILKEEVEVKSLKTLNDLNNAIDKWLRPVGLTAFLKPLELVSDIVERIRKNRPDSVFSMIFLTDGYNNDCAWNDVIKTLKSIEKDITSSTFVEYGFYADSQKLTQMASILGGEKISCDGFDEFEPVFDSKISSKINGGKKILVDINEQYLYDFAFSVSNGNILLYNIEDNKILVGSDVNEIYLFSSKPIGNSGVINDTALYGAIYVLSDKLMNDDAEKVFYTLGDNYYYKMLSDSFGKQKLNSFKSAIKECVLNESKRYPNGKSEIQKIDENSYCLMNLIYDLGNINCLFYPNHPEFSYNRIGKKRVAKGSELSDEDKKRLSEAKNVEDAANILNELKEKNVDIKFTNTNPDRGYYLSELVWNEERANLSVLIKINGTVTLPNNKYNINEIFSFKYNTYTLIKDGIVNVEKLPVSYSPELHKLLNDNNIKWELYTSKDSFDNTIVIYLNTLPLINKGMVKSISANELAKQEWELIKLQGEKKVYDFYRKQLFPKTSDSYIKMLEDELGSEKAVECAEWLKEIGITDYNGFAPKTNFEESTDFYMSVNLITKIAGLSSLPKVDDVLKKITENKPLKVNDYVMSNAIIKYNEQLNSDIFKSLNEDQQKEVLKTYLINKTNELNKKKRSVMQSIAQIKFSLILSKRWFNEFKSFDENKLNITLDNQNLEFTFLLTEKEVQI